MTTTAPDALYGIYRLIKPHLSSMRIGGVVGDVSHQKTGGYHISRADILRKGLLNDYSIQAPADNRGDGTHACGIDITLNAAEMKVVTARLRKACTPDANGNYDQRIEPIREFIGTLDGVRVCGYNRYATGSGTRSKVGWVASGFSNTSHLWHVHVSFFRDYADDKNATTGVAEVIAGLEVGKLGWVDPAGAPAPTPVEPAPMPVYWVDPAKVETFLWGVKHSTGEAVKQRPPGYEINTGVKIITFDERQWLLTAAGYRYALDYLTTTEPAPLPPAPIARTENVLTINVLKENIDPPGHQWHQGRREVCIAAIKSTGASLIGAQECRPIQRGDIEKALGYSDIVKGNVVLFYDPAKWSVSNVRTYDLKSGDDDRWLVAGDFTFKPTNVAYRVGCTHLTNLEGPDGGDAWRKGQAREILAFEPDLDMLFGDFNSYTVSLSGLKAVFAGGGLIELWKRAPADARRNANKNTTHHFSPTKSDGRRIDDILTRSVKVLSCGVLLLDPVSKFRNASDHNAVEATLDLTNKEIA